MANQSGQVYGLTVLSPIRQDDTIDVCHATELRWYLSSLPLDHSSPFARIDSTHLARLVVMDDVVFVGAPACEEHLKSRYLVFETNFDGDLDTYLERLASEASEFVNSVWKHCVGYPENAATADFVAYIKKCQIETTFFFAAVNDRTATQNLKALEMRDGLAHFIEEHQGMPPADVQKAFGAFLNARRQAAPPVRGRRAPGAHKGGVSGS